MIKGEEMPSIVDKRVKYVGNLFHLSLKNQEASKLEGKMIANLKTECIAGEIKGLCTCINLDNCLDYHGYQPTI